MKTIERDFPLFPLGIVALPSEVVPLHIFEDRYKTFRLWEDPERVLAETTPCQQANGVDPSRARELVLKTFGPIAKAPAGGHAAS